MAKDPKVISLAERRRGKQPADKPNAPAMSEHAPAGPTHAAPEARPVVGRLIWLYCPTCRTLEYTEMELRGGRTHNVCGTQVHEAAVELDLRAEATIARINLERLELLQSLVDSQRQRYEEYVRRLNLAARQPIEPYAQSQATANALPVAEVDAFGLLVSRFFADPAARFPELATRADPADASGDASTSHGATADTAVPGDLPED